jgi:hypothetical protein
MAHDERRAAERGPMLLTGRVAERLRQKEASAPLPAPASPTAHQCNWCCCLNLCYPVGRGREAFLPLGIFPSRQARSDRRLQEVEGGVEVAPRGRDCAAAPVSYCSRPRRAPTGGDATRKDRGSREKSWLQIGEGHGEGEGSSDSEGLKVNRLRGFERSTPLRGTASTAGSGQPSNSGCRSLDRARRPSCSNESVRSKKLVAAGRARGAREVGPRLTLRRGRLGATQGKGGKEGKDGVSALGVKVAMKSCEVEQEETGFL